MEKYVSREAVEEDGGVADGEKVNSVLIFFLSLKKSQEINCGLNSQLFMEINKTVETHM